jgi:tRNA_anti-like
MKPFIRIGLIIIFILAVTGILTGLYFYNLKPKDLNNVKPDFTFTAEDFQKAFEEIEKAASAKYINKIIELKGEIVSFKQGENNSFNISLKTGNELSLIICTFPSIPDSTGLKAGGKITIRGVCSGFLMDVLLNNCAIIKLSK